MERPRAVAEVALDLADDRRYRVRRELHLALRVEALDREQQADRADLDEVLLRLPAPGVPGGEALHQRHVAVDELLAGLLVAGAIRLDQRDEVDVLAGASSCAGASRRGDDELDDRAVAVALLAHLVHEPREHPAHAGLVRLARLEAAHADAEPVVVASASSRTVSPAGC